MSSVYLFTLKAIEQYIDHLAFYRGKKLLIFQWNVLLLLRKFHVSLAVQSVRA